MNLVTQMNNRYHTLCCVYQEVCTYTLEGARTVPDAVENLRKGIALGGMETFGAISKPVQDDSKKSNSTFHGDGRKQNSIINRRYT